MGCCPVGRGRGGGKTSRPQANWFHMVVVGPFEPCLNVGPLEPCLNVGPFEPRLDVGPFGPCLSAWYLLVIHVVVRSCSQMRLVTGFQCLPVLNHFLSSLGIRG